jgi:hypothetical protein
MRIATAALDRMSGSTGESSNNTPARTLRAASPAATRLFSSSDGTAVG